jgi:flagellar basal-body rod protein FlgC
MSLFKVFEVSSSAVSAQSQRLNVVASNLANADSATGADGKAYRARHVTFESMPLPVNGRQAGAMGSAGAAGGVGVKVGGIVEDQTPMRRLHDPSHPMADAEGYVTMPNVNVVDEMVNMISASRSYQTNIEMMNTAKSMLMKVLTLGS